VTLKDGRLFTVKAIDGDKTTLVRTFNEGIGIKTATITKKQLFQPAVTSPSWATRLGDSLHSFEWDEFFAGLDALYAKICYGDSRGMAASEARQVERIA